MGELTEARVREIIREEMKEVVDYVHIMKQKAEIDYADCWGFSCDPLGSSLQIQEDICPKD